MAVLYTSMERDGALAEVVYHWSLLTPLPSKPMVLHEVAVSTKKTLHLIEAQLSTLGVEQTQYEDLNYRRTQEIGAAAEFLGCDGLIVPSARWKCENLVLFVNQHDMTEGTLIVRRSETVEWRNWGREHGLIRET
jgi:hypothetical protein